MLAFRRPLTALAVVVTSNFTAYTMVLTLVPLYSLELGASATLIGLLTAAIAFFPLFFAVRVRSSVDRLLLVLAWPPRLVTSSSPEFPARSLSTPFHSNDTQTTIRTIGGAKCQQSA